MAKNICLDCAYFLNCKKASEEIRECKDYKFIMRKINREVTYDNKSRKFNKNKRIDNK